MLIKRIRHRLRIFLGQYPGIFFSIIQLRNKKSDYIVRSDSRIVIEGFPRSGNTFCVAAFLISQNGQGHIGHHMHVPAQVMRGMHFQVPILILIRDPLDACVSYIVRYPYLNPRSTLQEYISFYQAIYPYRNNFTVATFEEITEDFGKVLRKVNQKFGLSLSDFEHNAQNLEKVFELIDLMDREDTGSSQVNASTVARPDQRRQLFKHEVKNSFLDKKLETLLSEAKSICDTYRKLAANEDTHRS